MVPACSFGPSVKRLLAAPRSLLLSVSIQMRTLVPNTSWVTGASSPACAVCFCNAKREGRVRELAPTLYQWAVTNQGAKDRIKVRLCLDPHKNKAALPHSAGRSVLPALSSPRKATTSGVPTNWRVDMRLATPAGKERGLGNWNSDFLNKMLISNSPEQTHLPDLVLNSQPGVSLLHTILSTAALYTSADSNNT